MSPNPNALQRPGHRAERSGQAVGGFADRIRQLDHLLEVDLARRELRVKLLAEPVELARH